MATSEGQQRNVAFALEAFDVWLAGDVDGTLAMFDEELEIHVPSELGNSGTYRGRDEFLAWTKDWDEAWDEYEMSVLGSEPLGERHVISRVHQSAKGAGSGVPVEMEIAWLTEIRDGKIAALHLYPTEDDARRAGREREAG
jgi:ketosteroid isomerase-like protein